MLFVEWEEVALVLLVLLLVGHWLVDRESLVWTDFAGRRRRGLRSHWDRSRAGMAVQKYCGLWGTVKNVLSTDARATLRRWLTRNRGALIEKK